MKKTYYSNGKLLLTSEYVVLDGALALALPTKFGQNLTIESAHNNVIYWKSYDADNTVWFTTTISFESIIKKEVSDEIHSVKNTLIEILHQCYIENPNFIVNSSGYSITTQLTFPKKWGLGTSSTLINNLAQWLDINAYKLLQNTFGGSGYDIACAQNNSAVLYQLINENQLVETVNFNPDFKDKLFFVYLNKKQNSREAIAQYQIKQGSIYKEIGLFNAITQNVLNATHPKEFALELEKHEIELSNILEVPTIKEIYFDDFNGIIKSLGAWGGDFVLAISKENPTQYFHEKGFETVIPYQEIIL